MDRLADLLSDPNAFQLSTGVPAQPTDPFAEAAAMLEDRQPPTGAPDPMTRAANAFLGAPPPPAPVASLPPDPFFEAAANAYGFGPPPAPPPAGPLASPPPAPLLASPATAPRPPAVRFTARPTRQDVAAARQDIATRIDEGAGLQETGLRREAEAAVETEQRLADAKVASLLREDWLEYDAGEGSLQEDHQ